MRYSDRGSATVEMTLLTPLLVLMLVFVAVIVHRGVSVRLRLDAVVHQAARAASLERTSPLAESAARAVAIDALTDAGVACESFHVSTSTHAGTITVTLACSVDLTDALLPNIQTTSLTATAAEPIDVWRAGVDR